MADFKVIETQEQLDNIIGERLSRDRETQAKKYEGFVSPEDYQKKVDEYEKQVKGLSETIKNNEQIVKEVENYKAQIKKYETDSVKTRVAHEVGLPYGMAERLRGESEEDIRKDAETLQKLVNKKPAPPARSDDPDKIDSSRVAMKNMLEKLKE